MADVHTHDQFRCPSRRGRQESRQQEPPISQHHCRCQLPRHPRSWIQSCPALPPPRRHSRRNRSTSSRQSHQRMMVAPDSPQPTSPASSSSDNLLTVAVPALHILLVFVRLLLGVGRGLVLAIFALVLVLGLVRLVPTTGDVVTPVGSCRTRG